MWRFLEYRWHILCVFASLLLGMIGIRLAVYWAVTVLTSEADYSRSRLLSMTWTCCMTCWHRGGVASWRWNFADSLIIRFLPVIILGTVWLTWFLFLTACKRSDQLLLIFFLSLPCCFLRLEKDFQPTGYFFFFTHIWFSSWSTATKKIFHLKTGTGFSISGSYPSAMLCLLQA